MLPGYGGTRFFVDKILTMRLIQCLAYGLILVLGTSCSGKFQKAMLGGTLEATDFLETLTYENRMGLMVIEVELAGKKRRFVLDSGAPNLLSKELAEELALPALFSKNVGDSQGASRKLDFVEVPEFKVGDLVFEDMLAVVGDLNASPVLRCLEVEGLIGANLMRRAHWQIDYQAMEIRIASSLDSLPRINEESIRVPFTTSLQGTPKVDFLLEGIEAANFVVDLGSNSGLDGSFSWYRKNRKSITGQAVSAYGAAESGLYGNSKDSSYITVISSVKSKTDELGPHVVEFEGAGGFNIGNAWLDQFLVTFDWKNSELHLLSIQSKSITEYGNYGFKPVFADNQLKVGYVVSGSPAEEAGMVVGNRIFFLNGVDCLNLTNDQFCELVVAGTFKKEGQLDILFEDADGKTSKATLVQKHYFRE